MLKAIQRFLIFLLIFFGVIYLVYQALLFSLSRDKYPADTTAGGVNIAGLTRDEAAAKLSEAFFAPLNLYHQGERVQIDPREVGFTVDTEQMLNEVDAQKGQSELWQQYVEFVLNHTAEPTIVRLSATHDRNALIEKLNTIASYLDKPATSPQMLTGSGGYEPGKPGYVTNIPVSVDLVEKALYQFNPNDRNVNLALEYQEPIPFNIQVLQEQIERQLQGVNEMIGAVFIMNLETGEEVNINSHQAISGLSILKIAIFLDAYLALDQPPNEYVQELFYNTAALSSNNNANLLLHIAAGEDNTYQGAQVLTEDMQKIGLVNTFMAIPYDAPQVATRPSTYTTPANSDPNSLFPADKAMQTTPEEIGTLLSMIYYCAQGEGALPLIFPGRITPEECQSILDLMKLNYEGNLIRFGVPEGIDVSHKHGWDLVTHGDAGIVFTPGADYVIVMYLHDKANNWLNHEASFPILQRISQATYNFFNFEDPYTDDVLIRAEREVEAIEAAERAAEEAAAEGDAAAESETEELPGDESGN
jgi:beta-lactamase class A